MVTYVVVSYVSDSIGTIYAGGSAKDAFFVFEASVRSALSTTTIRLEIWENGIKVHTINE